MGIFNKGQVEYDDEINIVHEIVKVVLYVALIILIVFLIIKFVGCRSEVIGHSMESTLHDGESIWMDKLSYRFHEPSRFDIVIFPYQDSDTFYIKRIIGLPGETIYIDENGDIYIGTQEELYAEKDGSIHNGADKLDEAYGNEVIRKDCRGIASVPITIGEGEYFVMGDNRNNSHDSRYEEIGAISIDIIEGKATFRLWPLKELGKIDKQ